VGLLPAYPLEAPCGAAAIPCGRSRTVAISFFSQSEAALSLLVMLKKIPIMLSLMWIAN